MNGAGQRGEQPGRPAAGWEYRRRASHHHAPGRAARMALLAPRPVIHLGWLNERAGATRRLQPAALSSVRRSRSHAPIPDAAMGAADSAALAQAHVSVSRVRPSIVARTVAGAASACRMSTYLVLRRCRVCEGGSIRGRPPPSGGTCSGELYDSSTSWYIPFEDAYGIASTDPAYRVPPITSPIESPHCCGIQNSQQEKRSHAASLLPRYDPGPHVRHTATRALERPAHATSAICSASARCAMTSRSPRSASCGRTISAGRCDWRSTATCSGRRCSARRMTC